MSSKIIVDAEICKGCGLCVHACPKKFMIIDRQSLNSKGYNPAVCEDEDKCIACAMCAIMCPDSAITVEKEEKGEK